MKTPAWWPAAGVDRTAAGRMWSAAARVATGMRMDFESIERTAESLRRKRGVESRKNRRGGIEEEGVTKGRQPLIFLVIFLASASREPRRRGDRYQP